MATVICLTSRSTLRCLWLSLRSWRYCKRPWNKVLDKRAAKPRGEWGEGLWNTACQKTWSCKVSLGKYMRDHLTFDWRVYFSRPIRFPRTPVCGPFKKLKFSGRRYFRVLLPILLAASPLACPKLYFAGAYNTASYAGYLWLNHSPFFRSKWITHDRR